MPDLMPYPCCCRQTNNGEYCDRCGVTTPAQWALTWPEIAIQYQLNGVLTDIIRIPTGTHILSQTPGAGGCCWNGPAFYICTNTQNVDRIARLFVWRTTEISTDYLTANWTFQPATLTPTQLCGTLGGNNQVGRVRWSKATLAGCRSGPYTAAVTASEGFIASTGWCSQSPFLYSVQTAGDAVLDDVST